MRKMVDHWSDLSELIAWVCSGAKGGVGGEMEIARDQWMPCTMISGNRSLQMRYVHSLVSLFS